jgi:DNA invertase Pin-like site-specific DNA recombinase
MIAAIYARKSTDQNGVGEEEKSVARQIEHAKAYAVRKGWTIDDAHVYSDDGISGAEFKKRPGFLKLLNALSPRPPFQVLVMSEESRLGREAIETGYVLKQIMDAGVRVFFYLEDRERTLDTAMDKVVLSLTNFASEMEREKARQRTYDAMVRKAKALHVTGGKVYGYDNVDVPSPEDNGSRLRVVRQINEEQAAIVRRVFELYASGVGMVKIAHRLNQEGVKPPRGRGWAPSGIREMLHRELYRGVVVWNRSQKIVRAGTKKQRKRDESEWIRIEAPELRIVSDDLWQRVKATLDSRAATFPRGADRKLMGRPRYKDESSYLLVGFAKCSTWRACGDRPSRLGSRRGTAIRAALCVPGFEAPRKSHLHQSGRSSAGPARPGDSRGDWGCSGSCGPHRRDGEGARAVDQPAARPCRTPRSSRAGAGTGSAAAGPPRRRPRRRFSPRRRDQDTAEYRKGTQDGAHRKPLAARAAGEGRESQHRPRRPEAP